MRAAEVAQPLSVCAAPQRTFSFQPPQQLTATFISPAPTGLVPFAGLSRHHKHIPTWTHIHAHMLARRDTHKHRHRQTHAHVYTQRHIIQAYTDTYMYTNTCMCTQTHMHIHIDTHAPKHTCIHVHTYTDTHIHEVET